MASSVARPINHTRIAHLASRAYSTESDAPVAAEAEAEDADVKFDSLKDSVHPNLLRAIISEMGYDTMTPVQAKTILPSLNGSDM